MRVIQVAPTPFGSGGLLGGGERYPLELARALAREGVESELVTFGSPAARIREASGLRVRTMPPIAFVRGHPAHPVVPSLPGALSRADIVHVHHMRATPSRMAAVAARLRDQRIVVTDHGLDGSDWLGVLPRLFQRFLLVSRYSARELRAPPSRTRVIYGGADPERYRPDRDARRDGVLFVGRITPHKGVDRLIEALPAGARLRVVGSAGHDPEPPERDYPDDLRRMASGKDVGFAGPVPDDDLPMLYRSAAVFVLPSVHRTRYGKAMRVSELLGLSVIEAMASGTPVIASRIGGVPEVVQDGVTGYLVEPGDTNALRERLEAVLRDSTLAARLGRNARDVAVERFTWAACASRAIAAYRELMNRGSDRRREPSSIP